MQLFNDGWQFAKGNPEGFAPVALPHDWLICDTDNLYESGTGWYRRELDAGFLRDGQRLILRFDGVYMDSTLFVNGKEAGEWKYGFTAFEHDITDHIHRNGMNTLLLKVDCKFPSARWYTGAGIYRDVFLIIKNACRFISDGIYITTGKRDGRWYWEADAEVETGGKPYEVRHTLQDAEGDIVPWDIDDPRLYTLRSELLADGHVEDTEYTRFGFRTTEFTPDRGFSLNGRPVKMNGVCLHHDLGALGAAVHRDAVRRQLTLLRGMGVNAIRTAHNPPAKAFMELADEMGFLVMSELTDMWLRPKNPFDYAQYFDEWVERDAASWIRRDRNCPSVILWSIGNEIYDTHADAEDGAKTMRRLMALVKKHDPKAHAPATLCSNYMTWDNTQKCADIIKIIGYNYTERLYAQHHAEYPDWVIYGGETSSTVQSRNVYHFPLDKSMLADDDLQCSSLGNSTTSWGAKNVEECIIADRDTPFSFGHFVWAGQDYIGEPTPYHTRNSYFGQLDTAGFPKDSYYLFQAAWTDCKSKTMVHIYPYWDFSPGQVIDVRACSNAQRIELFLDDKSLGVKELEGCYIADWQVSYRPGTLRAVAYNEEGAIVAEDCRYSFGDAVTLRLEINLYGGLAFVEITAVDKFGNIVENANRRVRVRTESGQLLGLDNGDSADCDPYQTDSKRLFGGKLLAIVKTEKNKFPIIGASFDEDDIPVRKIELTSKGYTVTAKAFPENTTYKDLHWRLTDAGGIDSPLARLEVSGDGSSVRVIPGNDGDVYVRCSAYNGTDHPALYTYAKLTITGMGRLLMDPYNFISGGLYNRSNTELTNGNERGVATLRGVESHAGFADLDFGSYGSDELTLPLFPLEKDPFTFEIWEGMPLEGGVKLCDVLYDKGAQWNTYREITCRLPRRLRGVTTLCLVFRQKVHIKGFLFKKYDKAFEQLPAAENDGIYGDSFTIKDGAVENIGNNVTILFKDMDFGVTGATRLALCWRSRIQKNSIKMELSGVGGDYRQMIELPSAGEYLSAEFQLDGTVTGKNMVTLVFLPGTSMDLAWIRFIR